MPKSTSRPISSAPRGRLPVSGYKLWKSRSDYASAAVGVGHKQLDQVSGDSERGAIGYIGLRFRRSLSDVVSVDVQLDTDFGGDNRTSEASLSLKWKVREPISVKFKYEARNNSNIVNPLNTFDDGVEAALGVSVEVDLFPVCLSACLSACCLSACLSV